MTAFERGQQAGREGKAFDAMPAEFITGRTKLGAPKFGEDGEQWLAGRASTFRRKATKAEIEAAASVDVARFRRKSNRHYR